MVRHKVLTLGTVGSNPTGAAINDFSLINPLFGYVIKSANRQLSFCRLLFDFKCFIIILLLKDFILKIKNNLRRRSGI